MEPLWKVPKQVYGWGALCKVAGGDIYSMNITCLANSFDNGSGHGSHLTNTYIYIYIYIYICILLKEPSKKI